MTWIDPPPAIARLLDSPSLTMVARIALTCAFWWGGLAKLADFAGARDEAAHFFGTGPAVPIAVATIVVELVGSGLLIAGRLEWLAAGALAVFTAIATYIAHAFWNAQDPAVHFRELNTFLEHIGLIGGLALAAMLAYRTAPGSR
jgi:transmembrane protein